MRYLILVSLLLFSCGSEEETEGWFCWKPGTDLHDGPCVDACMEPGDPTSYCYCSFGCFGISEYE